MNGYILFGVRTGSSYPSQYGGMAYSEDINVPVAIFEDFDEAEEYIHIHRLKNPNFSKSEVFFKSSLLAGFDRAYVYQSEIPMFRAKRVLDEDNEPWIIGGNDGAIFENERIQREQGGW